MDRVVAGIGHKQAPVKVRERFGMPEPLRHVFGELTPEQEQAIEALTQGLVNNILHTPFTELKQAAGRPDRSEFIGAVETIFHPQAVSPTRPAPIIH